MKLSKFALSLSALFFASLFHAQTLAKSAGRVVVYCSALKKIVCGKKLFKVFLKIQCYCIIYSRNSSGSTLAKMLAEKIIPQADVWFGGPFGHTLTSGGTRSD